jgi:hypothetical protein
MTKISIQQFKSLAFSIVRRTAMIAAALALTSGPGVRAANSDAARAELRGYVENVTQATGRRYGVTDNAGNSMDCADIIANPSVAGQFIAVYHTTISGIGRVNVATSTDLLNWTWVRTLAGSASGSASQPTIKASGSAFVMA